LYRDESTGFITIIDVSYLVTDISIFNKFSVWIAAETFKIRNKLLLVDVVLSSPNPISGITALFLIRIYCFSVIRMKSVTMLHHEMADRLVLRINFCSVVQVKNQILQEERHDSSRKKINKNSVKKNFFFTLFLFIFWIR
jgi:uncharacterized oligopeptide transporter (OPT) family protein